MIRATPGLILFAGVMGAYWMIAHQDKVMKWKIPTVSRDPRWKNRNQIIDFIYWSLMVSGTMGIAIIGVMN